MLFRASYDISPSCMVGSCWGSISLLYHLFQLLEDGNFAILFLLTLWEIGGFGFPKYNDAKCQRSQVIFSNKNLCHVEFSNSFFEHHPHLVQSSCIFTLKGQFPRFYFQVPNDNLLTKMTTCDMGTSTNSSVQPKIHHQKGICQSLHTQTHRSMTHVGASCFLHGIVVSINHLKPLASTFDTQKTPFCHLRHFHSA